VATPRSESRKMHEIFVVALLASAVVALVVLAGVSFLVSIQPAEAQQLASALSLQYAYEANGSNVYRAAFVITSAGDGIHLSELSLSLVDVRGSPVVQSAGWTIEYSTLSGVTLDRYSFANSSWLDGGRSLLFVGGGITLISDSTDPLGQHYSLVLTGRGAFSGEVAEVIP
jgi:hypothetical protein